MGLIDGLRRNMMLLRQRGQVRRPFQNFNYLREKKPPQITDPQFRYSERAREIRGRDLREQIEMRGRQSAIAEIQKIMNQEKVTLQEALNFEGKVARIRNQLREAKRFPELQKFELRMLFIGALARGEARNFQDMTRYYANWLAEMREQTRDPKYDPRKAPELTKTLISSFNPQQRVALKKQFDNLAMLARGGDPYA